MAFVMISFLIWEAWQIDYGPKPVQPIISETPTVSDPSGDLPVTADNQIVDDGENSAEGVPLKTIPTGKIITIKTDVLALELDTKGGTLLNLDLLQYPLEKKNTVVQKIWDTIGMEAQPVDTSPVRLFDGSKEKLFLAQSGLIASAGSAGAPDHHENFTSEQDAYEMHLGEDTLNVPVTWTNNQGLTVTKNYEFTRGSYNIKVTQTISNQSGQSWVGRQYNQLLRVPYTDKKDNNFIRTFAGGVIYTQEERYQKIEFEDMAEENLAVETQGGWTAMSQHYFASAWVPPADQINSFYTKELSDWRYVIGSYSPAVSVADNSQHSFHSQLFAGPKIQPEMEKIAEGLELTVDYSFLTVVAKPIYWLLNKFHTLIENWGVAILCVTFCIKLLFFPLSQASYRSMAKMRKIQPKLKALQEKYKDDRQRFNTEMMAMYKREQVNPLGGCLPIMVQIPVFISLYWVLVETVELRQTEFALWIQDLSAQDPFFILPLLMGLTMKIQQSLNPPPIDPLQAKVMKMFPIVFTVFFLFFPSGLVLYWVCNNTLSILQQWYITRQIEAGK